MDNKKIFSILLIITLLYRTIALILTTEPISPSSTRGYLSDIVQCLLLYFFIYKIRNKILYKTIISLYIIIIISNFENILTNNCNLSYEFYKYLFNKEIIQGSLLTPRPILLLVITLLSIALFSKLHIKTKIRKKVMFPFFTLSLMISPLVVINSSWHQESILEQNLKSLFINLSLKKKIINFEDTSITSIAQLKEKNKYYELIQPKDLLKGTSILNKNQPEKNILLIFIEGLSQQHIKNNLLKNIKSISENNFSASRFISSQRQTNKGLYASLCGKYPNLISYTSKPDIIGTYGVDTKCIPEILKDAGYHTLFLQSADLGFMRKGLFTSAIGYSEIIGDPSTATVIFRNEWGIDDATLYETAINKIQNLKNKKWFITLLTTSTHHPYTTPLSPEYGDFKTALKYADSAIEKFILQLKKHNILENTLVIITSDESNGTGRTGNIKISNLISDNHVPFIVIGKRTKKNTIQKKLYSQTDIPISILDYIKSKEALNMRGRSIFRDYETKRNLFFGNVLKNIFGYFKDENNMLLCSSINYDCSIYQGKNLIENNSFIYNKKIKLSSHDVDMIQNLIDINEIKISNRRDLHPIFSSKNEKYHGAIFYNIIREFNIEGNNGDIINIELTVTSNEDDINISYVLVEKSSARAIRKYSVLPKNTTTKNKINFIIENTNLYGLHIAAETTIKNKWNLDNLNIYLDK